MAKSTKDNNTFEIEVEIDHGIFDNRTVERKNVPFTMATDVAFEILDKFGQKGKTYFTVYLCLLKHRNMTNNKCFPSRETIHKETNISIRTIQESIDALENEGYIKVNSGYKGISSNYYFPKEWFFEYFEDDICQQMAKRRKSPLSEKRETKAEKENKELRNEVERLKRELEKEKFKSNDYTYSKTADYDSEDPFADYLDEENPFTKCRTLYTTR